MYFLRLKIDWKMIVNPIGVLANVEELGYRGGELTAIY